MLDSAKKNIRKEACWTISNITAGTGEQIQAVINANLFPKLIELLTRYAMLLYFLMLHMVDNGWV